MRRLSKMYLMTLDWSVRELVFDKNWIGIYNDGEMVLENLSRNLKYYSL